MTNPWRLYLVADPDHAAGDLGAVVEAALRGGVTAVQLRAKRMTDRDHIALATRLAGICHAHRAALLVNDRLDIALAAGADGVHLGVNDLPIAAARRLAPDGFLIGFSPERDDQIANAAAGGSDYLGIGPVFGTLTKPDAGEALGLEEFRRRCVLSRLPVVGIGGINAENAASTIKAGACGVAVVSAILCANDPERAAHDLLGQVETSVR